MSLIDILHPDCIKVPLTGLDKRACLGELVDLLAMCGKVPDPNALKEAVWTREQVRTTGIGLGVGIPHGKLPGLTSLLMAIGKPETPLEYGSIDGKPVQMIILLASPPERNNEHIQTLAAISKLMLMEEFRRRFLGAASAAEIYDMLKEQEGR